MKNLFGLMVLVCLLFGSCRKDDMNIQTIENNPPITTTTEASVYGLITDNSGNPIQDAMISMNNNNTITDENGYFDLSGFAVRDHGVLKVTKPGFYNAFPVFNAGPIKQYVEVKMIPREISASIASTSGGEVTLGNGAEVSFAASSFVDEAGNPYNGDVSVYLHYLDPTLEDISEIMPGDLSAVDQNNNQTLLTSMGMLNVELEGTAGQKLDINKAASITVPVPSSILSMAPASIPLWYFDEDTGYWIEEGEADLSNGVYTGTVEHFTFWNCDVPNDFVELSGQVIVRGTNFRSTVQITVVETGEKRNTKTDYQGFFSGKVPNGVSLLIEVFDQCGAVVYEQNLGSLNEDTKLEIIWILGNSNFTVLEGSVNNCEGNPVQNGYCRVITDLSNKVTVIPIVNGSINEAVAVCDAEKITIVPYDTDNLEFGSSTELDVAETINVSLIACGNVIQEGVIFEQDGSTIIHFIGCDVVIDENDVYNFSYVDEQGDGAKILYENVFVNWTQDPNNPELAMSTTWQTVGNIDSYLSIVGGTSSFVDYNTVPGEHLVMKQSNCSVNIHDASNGEITETHEGVDIIYTGLIQ